MSALRLLKDGTPTSKESTVVPIWIAEPKLVPPFVDFLTKTLRLPVAGQNAKTSPKELVLMSAPMAVPVDSDPLICNAVPHEPAGPVRRFTKAGLPLCQM